MKFIFAIVLLGLVGAAVAAPNNLRDLVYLIDEAQKQADDLTGGAKSILTEVRRSGLDYLDTTLVHQSQLIEDLKMDLKLSLVNKNIQIEPEQVHVFQESVLQLQNDVLEQESAISRVSHYKVQNLTQKQLLDWAQKLIKQATEALAKYAQSLEERALAFQVKTVEHLAKSIQASQSSEGLKVEQQLALHELTIQKLVNKAAWRQGHRV